MLGFFLFASARNHSSILILLAFVSSLSSSIFLILLAGFCLSSTTTNNLFSIRRKKNPSLNFPTKQNHGNADARTNNHLPKLPGLLGTDARDDV